MSEFDRFKRELRKYLGTKTPALAKSFYKETAIVYSEIIEPRAFLRNSVILPRLIEVAGITGINDLSTVLKHQRRGHSNKPDVSFGLYYLALIDDDYSSAIEPIEKVLFKGTKKNRTTLIDAIGWSPKKFNLSSAESSKSDAPQENRLSPAFPKHINEPRRVYRRLIDVSYAAMAGFSRAA